MLNLFTISSPFFPFLAGITFFLLVCTSVCVQDSDLASVLRPGDVLLSVNDKGRVHSVHDLSQLLRDLLQGQGNEGVCVSPASEDMRESARE